MNNGLRESNGEFVVVFDADFAPAPEFLLETVPYMLYENIGIVQTAQYFDVKMGQTRNWVQQLSSSTQDMFFCWAQPARNTADAGMCVGTNVVYRRSALVSIGGFPRVSSGGEDIVTGLDMYAKGYRCIYLPLCLAKGVCPDDFESTINQQYRWSHTSMLMFTGNNEYREAFKASPLNFKQKLVFLSGILYYSQSILFLITAVLPSLVMLWVYPWMVGPGNYLPIAPAMLGMLALPLIVRGWRPTTLRLILVYSVSHMLSAIDAVRGHEAGWVATGEKKKSGNMAPRAGKVLRTWVVITQILTWWALAVDIPVYSVAAYWPAIILCSFQTAVLLPLLLPGYGTVAQPTLLPHLIKKELRMFRRVRTAKKMIDQ
jgi:cellulose synthase (UDP-forming)